MNIDQRTIGIRSIAIIFFFLFISDDYFLRSSAEFVHRRMTILSSDFFSRWWFRVAPKKWASQQHRTSRRRRAWITFRGLELLIFVICFYSSRLWLWRMSQCTVGTTKIKKSRETNGKCADMSASVVWVARQDTFASLLCVMLFYYDFVCCFFGLRAVFHTILKQISWCHFVSHIFSVRLWHCVAKRCALRSSCNILRTFSPHSTHLVCGVWVCAAIVSSHIFHTFAMQWQKRHTKCSSRVNGCDRVLFVIKTKYTSFLHFTFQRNSMSWRTQLASIENSVLENFHEVSKWFDRFFEIFFANAKIFLHQACAEYIDPELWTKRRWRNSTKQMITFWLVSGDGRRLRK